jgi:hypothetical protein
MHSSSTTPVSRLANGMPAANESGTCRGRLRERGHDDAERDAADRLSRQSR